MPWGGPSLKTLSPQGLGFDKGLDFKGLSFEGLRSKLFWGSKLFNVLNFEGLNFHGLSFKVCVLRAVAWDFQDLGFQR